MRGWRIVTVILLAILIGLTCIQPAKAYTKVVGFNLAKAVVERLPPEWKEVFSTYYNLIDSSIAEVHDATRNASYNPVEDRGELISRALHRYSRFIEKLDEKNFAGASEELGAFIFFVTELANPVRLAENFSKKLVVKWEALTAKEVFEIVVGEAEDVDNVREYLRGLALEAMEYTDEALNAIETRELSKDLKSAIEGLLSRAATVSYTLVLKALGTHFSNMLPYAVAWIVGLLAVGILILNYKYVMKGVKKIKKKV